MDNNSYNDYKDRIKSAGEVENIVKEAFYNDDEDLVYEEITRFLEIEQPSGSPDDFHNLSVNFSRRDDYSTACEILEKGLKKYEYSTDLLADFLQIGTFCNKENQCKHYYDVLMSIPKVKWTWRGFSFSIDYLQMITDTLLDSDEIFLYQKIMLSLADDYSHYFPNEEDVYLARSDIYKYYKDHKKEIECLKASVQSGIKSPKCCLRLADYYFNQGKYEEALKYIERNKVEGIDVQNKINVGYMYYLSALCRSALLQLNKNFSDRETVIKIYQDFYITEETADNYTSYAKNIERQIFILETKTGIKYDVVTEETFNDDTSLGTEDSSDDNSKPDKSKASNKAANKKRYKFWNAFK